VYATRREKKKTDEVHACDQVAHRCSQSFETFHRRTKLFCFSKVLTCSFIIFPMEHLTFHGPKEKSFQQSMGDNAKQPFFSVS
jgi:hypothetical protein